MAFGSIPCIQIGCIRNLKYICCLARTTTKEKATIVGHVEQFVAIARNRIRKLQALATRLERGKLGAIIEDPGKDTKSTVHVQPGSVCIAESSQIS